MRWRTKKIPIGTSRGLWKFAWVPVECEGGVTVWLEKYYREEVWDPYGHDWRFVRAFVRATL